MTILYNVCIIKIINMFTAKISNTISTRNDNNIMKCLGTYSSDLRHVTTKPRLSPKLNQSAFGWVKKKSIHIRISLLISCESETIHKFQKSISKKKKLVNNKMLTERNRQDSTLRAVQHQENLQDTSKWHRIYWSKRLKILSHFHSNGKQFWIKSDTQKSELNHTQYITCLGLSITFI